MQPLNMWGIVMLKSEKRTLFRFLSIYLGSTFLLFLLATVIFYHYQKHHIIDTQNSKLKQEAERISQVLRKLHKNYTSPLVYPHQEPYHSAIYSIDKTLIFGSFKPQNIQWKEEYYNYNNNLFHIKRLKPYYLGATYLMVSRAVDGKPIEDLQKMLVLFLFIAGIFFTSLGIFLGKLFIAPMKEVMNHMNQFIEDTTHELNTPISTILTNIELIETLYGFEGKQEMRRIEIASKTLSRLYEDLTYLKLNHHYHRDSRPLNISGLIEERIEYFNTMIEAKQLLLKVTIEPNIVIVMDRNDALRMVDNLLSNAIKYNKKEGVLSVVVTQKLFKISDTGVGIKEQDLAQISGRFNRANKSEGGFGIGLDIVNQVVEQYAFYFKITSAYNHGTEVTIEW
ncbi:MAG TPA: HAMP domain-containing histidine kinase [Campylobacterales bacterium]|nr:HAMP domain-containing histidine kinase [Campylobacterales bacterium]HIP41530.1 HAMP domain-containing histidine kinase [Campylobacterales bacterium]